MSTINPEKTTQLQTGRAPVCRMFVYRGKRGSKINDATALPVHVGPDGRSYTGAGQIPSDYYRVIGWKGDFPKRGLIEPIDYGNNLWRHDKWELVSAKVDLSRIWSASKCFVSIARSYDAQEAIEHPPVRPEDVIVIEMGYADSPASSNASMNIVFYGVVDSVDSNGLGDRIVTDIIARDPMRYLINNKIRGSTLHVTAGQQSVNRADIILSTIYLGSQIDYFTTQVKPDGSAHIEITNADQVAGLTDEILLSSHPPGPDNSYLTVGRVEKSSRADSLVPPTDPNAARQVGMEILDKFPIDIIRHLSLVETAPKELYADKYGVVNYESRRTDARKLFSDKEEERYSRNYYYRLPIEKANIMSIKEQWTTIGSATNFVITSSQAFNSDNKNIAQVYVESPTALLEDVIEGYAPQFQAVGDKPRLRKFTTNRFVSDEALIDKDTSAAVALALFGIWGRDLNVGSVEIPGDHTLEIGEAIRLWNTPLFGIRSESGIEDQNSWGGGPTNGIFRVEALTHYFNSGPNGGFTTSYIFGPVTPDSAELGPDSNPATRGLLRFFIKTQEEWSEIYDNPNNFLTANKPNIDILISPNARPSGQN